MSLRISIARGFCSKPPVDPLAGKRLELPHLPYGYDAFEPAISGEIMRLHHLKHHRAYITSYNEALAQLDSATSTDDASAVVKLQETLKLNAAAHEMHSLFWRSLGPYYKMGGEPPKDTLKFAIKSNFGSLEALKQNMTAKAVAFHGSGWVWLAVDDKDLKRLVVETTANDDPLVTRRPGLLPLLGIDFCEHAYYLQYKNARGAYLKNIWKVIDWRYAERIYKVECLNFGLTHNVFRVKDW